MIWKYVQWGNYPSSRIMSFSPKPTCRSLNHVPSMPSMLNKNKKYVSLAVDCCFVPLRLCKNQIWRMKPNPRRLLEVTVVSPWTFTLHLRMHNGTVGDFCFAKSFWWAHVAFTKHLRPVLAPSTSKKVREDVMDSPRKAREMRRLPAATSWSRHKVFAECSNSINLPNKQKTLSIRSLTIMMRCVNYPRFFRTPVSPPWSTHWSENDCSDCAI